MSTVVVTGGSRGIGEAVVAACAARGDRVITCARDWSTEVPPREDVRRFVADLASPDGVRAFADQVADEVDVVDLLIHNAGIQFRHPLTEGCAVDAHAVRAEFAVNVCAVVELTDLLLPVLRRSHASVVVTVGSVVAFGGVPASGVYGATKAALHAYTESLRVLLAPSGVRVVEFVPPLTDTAMASRVTSRRKVTPAVAASILLEGIDQARRSVISSGMNRGIALVDAGVRAGVRAITR